MALSKEEIVGKLVEPGIIAVVRARSQSQTAPLAKALADGGVVAVEITMTTPNALEAIRETIELLGSRAMVGVGTVLDAPTARSAIRAGAQFVATPVLKPQIVDAAHAVGKPILLGAYSPSEAQAAFDAGGDFVKIFPADGLGAGYIRSIRAPLPHLKIIPTGGVCLETMESFLKAGCAALGVGSSMITKEILEREDWSGLRQNASAYVQKNREIRRRLLNGLDE